MVDVLNRESLIDWRWAGAAGGRRVAKSNDVQPTAWARPSASERLMLGVFLILFGASWLVLERMQLPVEHQHWLRFVLVVMRHREVPLCVVETKKEQCACAHQVLLERHPAHVRGTESALARQQRVLVRVELLFDVSPEHFLIYLINYINLLHREILQYKSPGNFLGTTLSIIISFKF
jgi:hypothetical protein